MKNAYLMLMILSMLVLFSGCSGENADSGKSEKVVVDNQNTVVVSEKKKIDEEESEKEDDVSLEQIVSDLQKKEPFQSQGLKITNIEVIKRQTNIDRKEDKIYLSITVEHPECTIIYAYELLYNLYNEGWILDEMNAYSDDNYGFRIQPKSIPDVTTAENYVTQNSLPDITSTMASHTTTYNITQTEMQNNYVEFLCTCYVEYENCTEIIKGTIKYAFSATELQWHQSYEEEVRRITWNDGVIGGIYRFEFIDSDDSYLTLSEPLGWKENLFGGDLDFKYGTFTTTWGLEGEYIVGESIDEQTGDIYPFLSLYEKSIGGSVWRYYSLIDNRLVESRTMFKGPDLQKISN